MKIFSCEKVSRYHENIPTIKDISLYLKRGELVGLLGSSGVGKTTLLNILSGVDTPNSGRVILDNMEITSKPGSISYMLQKDLLLPYKTIIENVSLPMVIKGTAKKQAEETAKKLMPQFGLAGYESHYPNQLSGGMKQRAALLRTFLTGNKVVLLDEPFSSLDPLTKAEMHQWYLEISKELGLTTLFITHDIEEALVLSNRIYILAGKPGVIADELREIPNGEKDFIVSGEFQQLKKRLLNAIKE